MCPISAAEANDIISKTEFEAVVCAVASQITKTYNGYVDHEEATGWAQLGVVRAVHLINKDFIYQPGKSPHKRILWWMQYKGAMCAMDEMRSARVVDRTSKGKLLRRVVQTKSLDSQHVKHGRNGCNILMRTRNSHEEDPRNTVENMAAVEEIFGQLDSNEKAIAYYHYYVGLPLAKIAFLLRVGESCVSQIHTAMLRRVRAEVA